MGFGKRVVVRPVIKEVHEKSMLHLPCSYGLTIPTARHREVRKFQVAQCTFDHVSLPFRTTCFMHGRGKPGKRMLALYSHNRLVCQKCNIILRVTIGLKLTAKVMSTST